jgi:hypothetical protein
MTKILDFARRDMKYFLSYGVNEAYILKCESLLEEFKLFCSDGEARQAITEQTWRKKNLRSLLYELICELRIAVELSPALNEWNKKRYHFSKFRHLNDLKFLTFIDNLIASATNDLPQFPKGNITLEFLVQLGEARDLLAKEVSHTSSIKQNRSLRKSERIILGNKLYHELRSLAMIGKFVFKRIHDARYSDYVLDVQSENQKQ